MATRETLERQVCERLTRQCRILLVGRAGVGKSSTLNTLLGAQIATVGEFEPETADIYFHSGKIGSVKLLVIDTPGLCDDREDEGNDERYVELISQLVHEIDLLLFVTTIDDSRVRSDELRALDLLTQTFGESLWETAVVVLTRADLVTRADFSRVLAGRSEALRRRLREITPAHADEVPFIAVSNMRRRLPDRRRWLPLLWVAALERMSTTGFEPFVLATLDRVEANGDTRSDEEDDDDGNDGQSDDEGEDDDDGNDGQWGSVGEVTTYEGPEVTMYEDSPDPPLGEATYEAVETVWIPGTVAAGSRSEPGFGVQVVATHVSVGAAHGPILVNGDQARVVHDIVEHKAPGLLERLIETGGRLVGKLKSIFGL